MAFAHDQMAGNANGEDYSETRSQDDEIEGRIFSPARISGMPKPRWTYESHAGI